MIYLKDYSSERGSVELSVVVKDAQSELFPEVRKINLKVSKTLTNYRLDSSPGPPSRLHNPPGHGISIDDWDPQLPEHVGHGALPGAHTARQPD